MARGGGPSVSSGAVPVSAAVRPAGPPDVLVCLGGGLSVPWEGRVVDLRDAGPLSAQRPDEVTVWAPAGAWWRAFRLLALFKSAAPEACLVLTDELPPLDLVPFDGRVSVVAGSAPGRVWAGTAAFSCADLRSDRIFRLLLDGRARRRPRLEDLLRMHLLAGTAHGARTLERWRDVLPVLFGGGLEAMMPGALRADLEELREAARDAEHAVTGGFHALDGVVRRPPEWEAGARRYLRLAAAHSPAARAAVDRWLEARTGWVEAPPALQEEYREAAARLLHRLVDDPWLEGPP